MTLSRNVLRPPNVTDVYVITGDGQRRLAGRMGGLAGRAGPGAVRMYELIGGRMNGCVDELVDGRTGLAGERRYGRIDGERAISCIRSYNVV